MQRYFIEKETDGFVQITGDDYFHIVKVMRMVPGDKIAVVIPNGKTAICEISSIEPEYVEASIIEWTEENRELPINVTIAGGLLKGDKWDLVVQKGTELGAASFIPFSSARSIVKLDEKKGEKKVERWSKIAKEAAEQSERNKIPEIMSPISFNDIIKMGSSFTRAIVAYEENARDLEFSNFNETLQKLSDGDSLLIVFGPEGGFSASEIKALKENGFIAAGLGPRILRAETAPLYSLSAISFYFELQR